ncbi:MAG: hypothetical protein LC745_10850, partial [Planctomycetia bacterium]|nr:hypothetical protein [Planctomycetia bacterium]
AWLVGVCSGGVLVVGGVLILVWRPPPHLAWVGGVVFGLSAATLSHPSVTYLVVQSGMVGLLLTALLAVMHRLLDRRRRGGSVYAEAGSRAQGLAAPGSTMSRAVAVGSDDSTAIRARPIVSKSTAVHLPVSPPGTPDQDSATSRPGRVGLGGEGQ